MGLRLSRHRRHSKKSKTILPASISLKSVILNDLDIMEKDLSELKEFVKETKEEITDKKQGTIYVS
jgi:hypothetical protein